MENSSNSNSKSSKYLFTKITPNSSQRIPITFSVSHVVKPHVYDKITEHGGFVIQGNNANYNIVDADKSSNTSAIDYHWILACVQQGTLVSTDKYRVKQGAVSRIHRVPYTEEDDTNLLTVYIQCGKKNSLKTWELCAELFPRHSSESYRNRFKKMTNREAMLEKAENLIAATFKTQQEQDKEESVTEEELQEQAEEVEQDKEESEEEIEEQEEEEVDSQRIYETAPSPTLTPPRPKSSSHRPTSSTSKRAAVKQQRDQEDLDILYSDQYEGNDGGHEKLTVYHKPKSRNKKYVPALDSEEEGGLDPSKGLDTLLNINPEVIIKRKQHHEEERRQPIKKMKSEIVKMKREVVKTENPSSSSSSSSQKKPSSSSQKFEKLSSTDKFNHLLTEFSHISKSKIIEHLHSVSGNLVIARSVLLGERIDKRLIWSKAEDNALLRDADVTFHGKNAEVCRKRLVYLKGCGM